MKRAILLTLSVLIITLTFYTTLSASVTDGTGNKTMTLDKTTFYEGEDIVVKHSGAESKDWVGFYSSGTTPGSDNPSHSWGYLIDTDGTYTFPTDNDVTSVSNHLEVGKYDIYYLLNDGYEFAAKIEIEIVAQLPTTEPTTETETQPETGDGNIGALIIFTFVSLVATTLYLVEKRISYSI